MYWYRYPIPLVSLYENACWYKKQLVGNAFLYRLIKRNATKRSKSSVESCCRSYQSTDYVQGYCLTAECCSGALLEAGHCLREKALNSQINSKLQNGPIFFFIPLLSSKRPQFTFTEQPLVAARRHYHVPITCCGAKNWQI